MQVRVRSDGTARAGGSPERPVPPFAEQEPAALVGAWGWVLREEGGSVKAGTVLSFTGLLSTDRCGACSGLAGRPGLG